MAEIITIPKKITKEGDLVVMPRREYEKFLKRLRKVEDRDEKLWRSASKKKLAEVYDKADAIYDKI